MSRLCVVLDHCSLSRDSDREEMESCKLAAEKFRTFGWESLVVDGHAFDELRYAFSKFNKGSSTRPYVIIARTIPGRGMPSDG